MIIRLTHLPGGGSTFRSSEQAKPHDKMAALITEEMRERRRPDHVADSRWISIVRQIVRAHANRTTVAAKCKSPLNVQVQIQIRRVAVRVN